jgi:hypothetical protein
MEAISLAEKQIEVWFLALADEGWPGANLRHKRQIQNRNG